MKHPARAAEFTSTLTADPLQQAIPPVQCGVTTFVQRPSGGGRRDRVDAAPIWIRRAGCLRLNHVRAEAVRVSRASCLRLNRARAEAARVHSAGGLRPHPRGRAPQWQLGAAGGPPRPRPNCARPPAQLGHDIDTRATWGARKAEAGSRSGCYGAGYVRPTCHSKDGGRDGNATGDSWTHREVLSWGAAARGRNWPGAARVPDNPLPVRLSRLKIYFFRVRYSRGEDCTHGIARA